MSELKRSPEKMITLDLDTFKQSESGSNVTGVIFLELQTGPYPEAGWSDFPVIVLSWWIEEHMKLANRTAREVSWRFMDGPYAVTFSNVDASVTAGHFDYAKMKRSLLNAAKKVIEHCARHEISNRDLVVLRSNVEKLQANQPSEPTIGLRPIAAHL